MPTRLVLVAGGACATVAAAFTLACASTGASMNERAPGHDTYVEPGTMVGRDDAGHLVAGYDNDGGAVAVYTDGGAFNPAAAFLGAIAVDERTETSYVLQAFVADDTPRPPLGLPHTLKTLWAVAADGGSPREVGRFDDMGDTRVLFPASGVMVMSETSGSAGAGLVDELRLYDPTTGALVRRATASVRYHGTRMSPSRRWVAVADNTNEHAPVHVIDGASLQATVVPHGGDFIEAMWLNQSDTLAAVTSPLFEQSSRLLVWDLANAASGSPWTTPVIDLALPGVAFDNGFSYTWIGVSPDDHYAVFPLVGRDPRGSGEDEQVLKILDLRTHEVRTVHDAAGPVAFTPDGSTIVSYRYINGGPDLAHELGIDAYEPDRDARARPIVYRDAGLAPTDTPVTALVLIDVATLAVREVPLPSTRVMYPTFVVTPMGHHVLVADAFGVGDGMILYDTEMGRLTRIEGPSRRLGWYVNRPAHDELWFIDNGLEYLDFMRGTITPVNLGWLPEQINILPTRDLLVLDRPRENALSFWSPSDYHLARTVHLPVPAVR